MTVSQTKNLINQMITVSWSGGAPTTPYAEFSRNFLQIMQCWGGAVRHDRSDVQLHPTQ
ncbi:MAG: hypothetical protein ACRDS0_02590 [Pseudonocardiaceae bacterium]